VDLEKEFCMSRETHLAALGQRHDALDKEIAKESLHPGKDELKLAEMKRRKLQLKDEIAKLQRSLACIEFRGAVSGAAVRSPLRRANF
jgi:hypothetical protein